MDGINLNTRFASKPTRDPFRWNPDLSNALKDTQLYALIRRILQDLQSLKVGDEMNARLISGKRSVGIDMKILTSSKTQHLKNMKADVEAARNLRASRKSSTN